MTTVRTSARRYALAAAAGLVTLSALVGTRARSVEARVTEPVSSGPIEPSDRWLKGLTASHKQFFDAPAPAGGIPLVHVMNYYDTYNKAYGVKDGDIDAVLTFYGSTTFHGLTDAAWAKYRLGEFLDIKDGSGKPVTANPWRAEPEILGMKLAPASIEALQKRGTTFILCNNALQIFSGMLAQKRGLDPTVVYEDLKGSILPGVELVPGMVIAVEQATRAGLSYHRQ
jgi:hypothetical protein